MSIEGVIGEAWIQIKPLANEFGPEVKADVNKVIATTERQIRDARGRFIAAGGAGAGLVGAEAAGAGVGAGAGAAPAEILATGAAVDRVSHHTRAAFAEQAAAQANLNATIAKYGKDSAEAAVASDRLRGAHTKLSKSMLTAETHAARLSGRIHGLGHGIIRSTGGLLVAGIGVEEGIRKINEAGTGFESAMAQVRNSTGETAPEVKELGDAFVDLAKSGDTTFKAGDQAAAYGTVAGQLKLAQGHALDTAEALSFMRAAEDDAEASGQELGSTTSALAAVIQTFHVPLAQVNDEADLLFNVSKSLNVPISAVATAVDKLKARLGDAAPSLKDVSGLMVQASRSGITGSRGVLTVSSAMQTLLSQASETGKGTKASLLQIHSAQIALQTSTDAVSRARARYGTTNENYLVAVEKQGLAQERLNALQNGTPAKLNATQQKLKDLGVTVYDASGKFVGMSSLIEQLQPKLAGMSDATRQTALATLFGSGSAQLMNRIIGQGLKGWDEATAAVSKHGTAAKGAAEKQGTLEGRTATLTAEFNAMEIQIADHLIPAESRIVGWLSRHQKVTEVLAGVIGGVMVLAIARYVGELVWASGKSVVQFGKMILGWASVKEASTGATRKIAENDVKMAATTQTAADEIVVADAEIETANRGAAASFGLLSLAVVGLAGDYLLLKKDYDLWRQGQHAQAQARLRDEYNAVQGQLHQTQMEAKASGVDMDRFNKRRINLLHKIATIDDNGDMSIRMDPAEIDQRLAKLELWVQQGGKGKVHPLRTMLRDMGSGDLGIQPSEGRLGDVLSGRHPRDRQSLTGGIPPNSGGLAGLLTGRTDSHIDRLIHTTDEHGRTQAHYANTANGFLQKIAHLADSIERNTATSAHHARHHQQRRFASSESR